MYKTIGPAMVAAALAIAASPSFATTYGFEDVTADVGADALTTQAGLTWSHMYVIHQDLHPGSGYDYGTISGAYAGWSYVDGASVSSATNFTLQSFYATAAWTNGNILTVTGYDDGALVNQVDLTLGTTVPLLATFGWDVDNVVFSTSADQFVIDEFTFNEATATVPLPASLVLLLGGLGALRLGRRRS